MFEWKNLSQVFPYGDLSIRQGEYQDRLGTTLEELEPEQRETLLDVLDLQWVCFIESLGILHDRGLLDGLEGPLDQALARLQIDSNARSRQGLKPRDLREALFKIEPGGLLDRIEQAAGRES